MTPNHEGGGLGSSVIHGLAERITDGAVAPGLRLVTMPMGVKDVVTLYGSLYGGDVFSPSANRSTADIVSSMLDKGTLRQDKFEISGQLESVGAKVSFSSDDYRVSFSARCLQADVPLIVKLLSEQLREPAFHASDLESLQKRLVGLLKRRSESTDYRAGASFSRLLYPAGHPNHVPPVDEQRGDIEHITPADLQLFHHPHYGLGSVLVVATGDLERDVLEDNLGRHLGPWQEVATSIPALAKGAAAGDGSPREEIVSMADKTSVDLLLGGTIGIDREHADFMPLSMGTYVLGGNFSARLMATLRDNDGLTYGIGSTLGGADDGKDGYWSIHGSFAPELLARGRAAVMTQFNSWVREGITEDELRVKKTTIKGSYKVGLATTSGMAAAILDILERGKEISYLDEYPGKIDALALDQVNAVIGQYIHPEERVEVAAGSIDGKGRPLAAG